MRASPLVFFAGILALIFFVSGAGSSALAGTPSKTPPPPVDERKLIKSVDAKSGSLVIVYMRDKSTHTYAIDGVTSLKVNNVAGKITDIKVGMVVDDYVERDNDSLDGLSLSGTGGALTPPKAKTPAKPKAPAQT